MWDAYVSPPETLPFTQAHSLILIRTLESYSNRQREVHGPPITAVILRLNDTNDMDALWC